jgi:ferredoxin, 2Fe-2S
MTILPIGKTFRPPREPASCRPCSPRQSPCRANAAGRRSAAAATSSSIEGRKGLSKPQRLENERLDSLVGVGSKSRLACQVIVGSENFTIELPSFA